VRRDNHLSRPLFRPRVHWIGTWVDINRLPGGKFAVDMGETQVRGSLSP